MPCLEFVVWYVVLSLLFVEEPSHVHTRKGCAEFVGRGLRVHRLICTGRNAHLRTLLSKHLLVLEAFHSCQMRLRTIEWEFRGALTLRSALPSSLPIIIMIGALEI